MEVKYVYCYSGRGGKAWILPCKTLLPYKHKIAIIEPLEDVCNKIANELNIPVVNRGMEQI